MRATYAKALIAFGTGVFSQRPYHYLSPYLQLIFTLIKYLSITYIGKYFYVQVIKREH